VTVPARTVSIAIPAYNGEEYLEQALRSIREQTSPPDEVLLFDNASTDGTLDIARRHLTEDQIRTARENKGGAWNFSRAVRESTGVYFAWLACDDYLAPRFVEACAARLDSRPDAVACLPGIRYVDEAGATLSLQLDDDALASPEARTRLRSILRRERWAESYCLYRRETLLASPIFLDEYGADVLLSWWLLMRASFAVVPEPLYEYRIYAVKSVEENATNLNPHAKKLQWRKLRMWRRLWQLAGDEGVSRPVRRIARSELLLCWFDRAWIGHLYEDLRLQASALAAPLVRRRP
jgi:glycosyltransferase involved in cell wall biosynthesis